VPRILIRAPKDPFEVHSPAETLDRNLIAGNSGNLVFATAAWKLLSAPGVTLEPDRFAMSASDADAVNERFDAYVVPLANAFRPTYLPNLERLTGFIRRLRIPVTVLGVGAHGTADYRWDLLAPIEPAVRAFMRAVLDRSPAVGVRGEGTAEYLRGLGFRDVEVIGCPSMFWWGDRIRVERRTPALTADSAIAITISPYRRAMGRIAETAHARYPGLRYVAQELDTLALLVDGTPLPGGTPDARLPVHPAHPLFRERRARLYVDPFPWIAALRTMDFVYGTRIHGAITALVAGTPAAVLVHDSRTLELARYFDIPHRRLAEVPRTLDPADLYASSDWTAVETGHGERWARIAAFVARADLPNAFLHEGAPEAFEARAAATPFPPAAGTPGTERDAARGRTVRRLRFAARRLATSRALRPVRVALARLR
jgi:hypothetical protein